MNITINPRDWITEKEVISKENRTKAAELFAAYKDALEKAGIEVSDTRIMLRVAEELSISLGTVRNICRSKGLVTKRERKGRPALAV